MGTHVDFIELFLFYILFPVEYRMSTKILRFNFNDARYVFGFIGL